MAGQIKQLIDVIIQQRAHGDPLLIQTTKTKLTLKGINVEQFHDSSADDSAMLGKVRSVAADWGVSL